MQSCSTGPGVWKNDEISSSKREDFHEMNKELLEALKAGNPQLLENIMSHELLEDHSLNREAHLISLRMKNDNYHMLNEYYMVHDRRGAHSAGGHIGSDKYTLEYDAVTKEMYMAFFLPEKAQEKMMITAVYCKYEYGWKLYSVNMGRYAQNGKNMPELLRQAGQKLGRHYLVDAINLSTMAGECAGPNSMWHYANEQLVGMIWNKATSEASKEFVYPYIIKQVPTHPRIIRIMNRIEPEGTFPVIYYQSAVKVTDTAAIRRENQAIQKVIGLAIPGMDKDKKYIYYTAYNEMPNYKKEVNSMDMVQKLQ
ncbi:hypothetical protein KHS38_16445 [Mucilaginibacter sp. Bleaf8]|uniref:hypothetical protein n=1 Tax=Mucilaginibacter sp. Bleaf8 TaxID=2834430 RepID=UPI001BCDA441|nr:hypothetical protein [Mucilaginibacter sp. Bleaf8]MBS7565998.1 hypothetical protein [Mucilaginibacter sp. Bleaf8]